MANTIIGRVLATEKNPTTIDNFTFWTDPEGLSQILCKHRNAVQNRAKII